jgi:very-short-patch-repair endonuclease
MRVKKGTTIEVLIEDLPKGSHEKVDVKCDYCGKVSNRVYKDVLIRRKITNKDCCVNCVKHKREDSIMDLYGEKSAMHVEKFKQKSRETCLDRYGIENPAKLKEVKDKAKKTNLEKYGVEYTFQSEQVKDKIKAKLNDKYGINNPMDSEIFRQKIIDTNQERYGVDYYTQTDEYWIKTKQTNLEKYGCEYSFQSEEIKDKTKNTMVSRYGVEHPMESDEFKNKIKDTCLEKYGVENYTQTEEYINKVKQTNLQKYGYEWALQSPVVREKISNTLDKHGNVKCSQQQKHICDLFNGQLNSRISWYFADILLEDDKIVVEYDGGGHDLRVKIGDITREEFERKELKRNNIFNSKGYNIIRIVSRKDKLLKDDEFIKLLEFCKNLFNNNELRTCIFIDIDEYELRCRQYTVNLDKILNN